MTWQSGGGAALPVPLPGKELGFAEDGNAFEVANTPGFVTWDNLTIPGLLIPAGTHYVCEFYTWNTDADTGATAGEYIHVIFGSVEQGFTLATVYTDASGNAGTIYARSRTYISNGGLITYLVRARNATSAAHGVFIGGTSPNSVTTSYLRIIAV